MRAAWRQSTKVFEERANEYDSWFEDSLLFEIEAAAIAALPLSTTAPSLEIGVGPGRFAQTFASKFGIDPARASLEIARSRGVIPCLAIGEALPFRLRSMARVSLFFTLCFLSEPIRVLHEIHQILHDSGQLILGFVPAEGIWGHSLQHKKETGHPFYKHANFHSTADVKTLLHDTGFKIKNVHSTLYQSPGRVQQTETGREGMDGTAGFVALLAVKE